MTMPQSQQNAPTTTLIGAIRKYLQDGGKYQTTADDLLTSLVEIVEHDSHKDTSNMDWAESPAALAWSLQKPVLDVLALDGYGVATGRAGDQIDITFSDL